MTAQNNLATGPEYGLIVQQDGQQQQMLMKFATLILNYQYGLDLIVASDLSRASSLCMQYRKGIRCSFIIQNERIQNQSTLKARLLQW